MADIESNIDININADQAISSIKQLQAQLSRFYQDLSKSGAKAAADAADLQRQLVNSVNATGKFAASVRNVTTTTESFTDSLERNKLSMGQYFRFAGSQVTGFRKLFSTEFDTIDKVARERVKTLQTQYIKLGRDANGAMKAIAVRPLSLDMDDLGTKVAMTAQKQQILNEVLKQGSTNLLNFGKNTQWAGRQLMVGFTIPLSIFGATAAREFMKLEEQTIRFQKVYGDFSTSAESTDKMTDSIRSLGEEFTKYGVAVEKTIGLAAEAAAMGKQGAELTAQVSEATRLAVLGGVEQSQALETTISLTNAFGISADKLSNKINFLNAVENQTVTSIEDLTVAIPKAGPVIQQLGGNVEDLAFFMTAMKEGGIDAGEGANALKSGLASMINPTQEASDMLASFGINLRGIVDANKGDIKATVVGFAEALNKLDPLNRAQAIEQLFGKFQFARISTLFQNVTDQASQANRVLQLTTATQEELAVLSEREMKRMEKSPMYQFQGAVERFQAALAPIGESFLKAVTPIINFGTEILNKFNEMGDGAKQFWTVLVAAVGGLGPVLLMTFGLLANGVANIIKMFTVMGGLFGKLSGQSKILGGSTQYMTQEQLEAASIAASLNQVHQDLIQTFSSEASAARALAAAYVTAANAAKAMVMPMIPRAGGATAPKKYKDGVFSVPGPKGAGDIVPAMLAPGEAVIPADKAQKYQGLIQGMVAGNIPEYAKSNVSGRGTLAPGEARGYTNAVAFLSKNANQQGKDGVWDRQEALSELTAGGDAIYAPVLASIAENLGAVGQAEIIAMINSNPEFASFVRTLSTTVIDGVASGVGDVSDKEIETHAKQAIANSDVSPAFRTAVEKTFSEVTTVEDSSLKRIKSSGAVDAQGRIKLAEETTSYRGRDPLFRRIASGLEGQLPEDYQLSHLVESTGGKLEDMVGTRTLTGPAREAAQRYASGKDTVFRQGNRDREIQVPSGTSPAAIREAMVAAEAGQRDGQAYNNAIDETLEDPYVASRDRNSPHKLAGQDGRDDGEAYESAFADSASKTSKKSGSRIDPKAAQLARDEAKAQYDAELRATGVSMGPAKPVVPKPKSKTLVTGEDSMTPTQAAQNAAVLNSGMLSGKGGKFAASMESATERLKERFPKYAGFIDEKLASLQKALDLDGSFAEKQEAQRNLLLSAEQKLADATNARAARINAGETGIPDIDPRSILDPEELAAYDSAQIARQRDLEKEDKRQRRSRLAGKVFGAGMVATTALGVASSVGGPVGEFAQNALPIAGAASTLLPVLMAMGPVLGSVVGVLAALVGGGIAFNNMLNEARDKGVKFAESMGMGKKAMDGFAEFAGRATSRDIGDKIRERQTSAFAFQSNEKTFGQSYVESESGKARIESLKEAVKLATSEETGKKLGLQLSAAVADNLMSPEQARSIAVNLGEQLDNQDLLSEAVVTINKVVGPNGENALDNGIDLKVNLMLEARDTLLEGQKLLDEGAARRKKKIDETSNRIKGIDPLKDAQAGVDVLGQGIANIFAPMQDAATASGMLAANMTQAIELTQQLVDATDIYWSKLRDAAIAQGDINKAAELEETRLKEKNRLLTEQNNIYKTLEAQVEASSAQRDRSGPLGSWFNVDTAWSVDRISRDQRWDTQRKSIEEKFGASGVQAANAIKDQANELATTGITEVRQVQLLAAMDAGTLDPSVAMDIVNIYASDEDMMTKVMNIITEMDPESANRVLALSQAFETEEAKKTFITRFEGASLDEQERYLEAYTFINKIAEAGDKELAVIMEFYNAEENIDLLEEVQKDLQAIEDTPDPQLNLELVGSVAGVDPALLQGYAEWFNSLPPEQKRAFTSIFTSIYQQIGSKDENVDYQNYLKENNLKDTDANFAQYAGETAKALTPTLTDITSAPVEAPETPVTPPSSGGGKGRESSVLDDILQKLRKVQMSTLALTEGWKGAREALDGLFPGGGSNSPFEGIEQQMRRLGAKEDLITMIAGMDPEEFQKRKEELFTFDGAGNIVGFRDSLLSIGAALRSIKFGEFQSEQQKNVNIIRDQNDAIRKLIANGFSMADAYEMVQDAAFASAVAQESNNEVIRKATEDYKKATEAAKLFAAAQAAVTANKDVKATEDALAFVMNNAGNLSNEVINEILTNPEFATLIMSPTLTQEQRDALQQWVNNIENEAQISLDIKLQTIEGMEDIFQDGFSKAMEAFSAQEKKIELEFAVKKDPFQKTIENAQNLIADIQNKPGGMDDLQADLDRISFKEDDINKRYKERLDRLQEIKRNNDKILQQKKAELTVADAITQGDIAAAAKAIEDARAQQIQTSMQAQQDMLQRQKEAELEALTGQMGMTREQIDTRIRDLRQEILNIEETMIEPAQYQLSLLERQEKRQKEALTVLGMTRREWETLNNRIQIAKTSSDEYTKAMESARDVVGKIVAYWDEIQKPKTTVHTIITNYVTGSGSGAGNIGASGDSGGSGNNSSNNTPTPAEAPYGNITPASLTARYNKFRNAPLNSVGGVQGKLDAYSLYKQWQYAQEKSPNGNAATTYAQKLGTMMKKYGYNLGGLVDGNGDKDTISAMLTPGEFVVTKPAVKAYGARMMKDINNGTFQSGSVYNYSISVNVETGADADQIANTVMRKIKNVDSKRIQGNRF